MFTIQLFSLHMEFSIRKKERSEKNLAQLTNIREIEQQIAEHRLEYSQFTRIV